MINYRIIQFSKATPPLQRAITANDNIGYIPIAPQVKDCIGTDKPTPEGKLRNDHLSFSWASNFEFCFRGQFPSKILPQVICLRERGMGLHKNCFPKCFNTKGLWKDLHWYWYNPCLFICQNPCYQARARSAGPRGLRAVSVRAFTGRLNSYSGRGEDFLTGQPDFFTETAVTPERKVEKWFPRWEIHRHAEG